VPEGLRRAVTARDRGCAFPGCDRPPAWCQIHHIVAWEHLGPTAIDNLVMVCVAHHRLAHHSGWEIGMVRGRPEFVPPGWIDPVRRPRRQPDLSPTVDLTAAETVVAGTVPPRCAHLPDGNGQDSGSE
jgi:5-methylcytosine-specific restriction protein A